MVHTLGTQKDNGIPTEDSLRRVQSCEFVWSFIIDG